MVVLRYTVHIKPAIYGVKGTSSCPGRVRLLARGCQPPAATRLRLAPPLAGGSEGGQERIEPGGAAHSWSDKEAEGVRHPCHKPPLSLSYGQMQLPCGGKTYVLRTYPVQSFMASCLISLENVEAAL